MKHFKTLLIILLICTLITPYLGGTVHAVDSDFDPNYILSDEELQNWQTMSRADIQAFLKEKGSYLSILKTEDENGVTRDAADIIFQAAKEYKINPKYILVKLQKEQSLITESNPTQKQLDGATGYGITDGCGWSCESYARNKGFGKQVAAAAGIMRWYYDNVSAQDWIKKPTRNYLIDGSTIKPANYATAFLYTYTPHLHGNKNFWNIWNAWFQQVYPDGTLLSSADDKTVYLLQNGKKRPFSNMTALSSRFDPRLVVTVSASEIAKYETGPAIALANYSVLSYDGQYYLVDYDTLRPFTEEVRKKLGYNPQEIIPVTHTDLASYTIGTSISSDTTNPIGHIVQVKGTHEFFYVKDSIFHSLPDKSIGTVNFPNLPVEVWEASQFEKLTPGDALLFRNGTLFKSESSNKVYVVEKERKRHIANEDVFLGLGYKWENIVAINEIAVNAHPTAEPVYYQASANTLVVKESSEIIDESNEVVNTANSSEEKVNPIMIRTSPTQTVTKGPVFETDIDAYVVMDAQAREVLAGKNMDVTRPIASLTKTLTAYRLFLEGLKPNGIVTYESAKHAATYNYFRTVDGEQFRNKHLLWAMLVSSLNTPSRMLVSDITPDESSFIARMNKQVKDFGLSKTYFFDTSGLDERNVSTAYEYAILFDEVNKMTDVRDILGMKSYTYTELIDKDDKPNHYDVHTNTMLQRNHSLYNIVSTKTGYLHEAGATLAMIVQRKSDGRQFIIVTLGDPKGLKSYNGEKYYDEGDRFLDTESLTSWAMETL